MSKTSYFVLKCGVYKVLFEFRTLFYCLRANALDTKTIVNYFKKASKSRIKHTLIKNLTLG